MWTASLGTCTATCCVSHGKWLHRLETPSEDEPVQAFLFCSQAARREHHLFARQAYCGSKDHYPVFQQTGKGSIAHLTEPPWHELQHLNLPGTTLFTEDLAQSGQRLDPVLQNRPKGFDVYPTLEFGYSLTPGVLVKDCAALRPLQQAAQALSTVTATPSGAPANLPTPSGSTARDAALTLHSQRFAEALSTL